MPNPLDLSPASVRAHRRRAEDLTRRVLIEGARAFNEDQDAIPLDLMVAFVYALASTIVAFEHARPGARDLVPLLSGALQSATEELRIGDARAELASLLVELQTTRTH